MIRTKLHTLGLFPPVSGEAVKEWGVGGLRKRGSKQKREGCLEKWGDKGGVTARVGGEGAYLLNI